MKKQMKLRSMYALLIAAATMIGITIYGSCSSDDDYFYGNELRTRADAKMTRGNENPQEPLWWSIKQGSESVEKDINTHLKIHATFSWGEGDAKTVNVTCTAYGISEYVGNDPKRPFYEVKCQVSDNPVVRKIDAYSKEYIQSVSAKYRELYYDFNGNVIAHGDWNYASGQDLILNISSLLTPEYSPKP